MLKKFKLARFTLYAIIILIALAHIVLSHRFSSPSMKQKVQAALSHIVGSDVKIKSIHLSGILYPKIVASDIQIINPDANQYSNAPYLAKFKQVELQANIHALLHHILIIKKMTLKQGSVYFITANQQHNWSLLLDHTHYHHHLAKHWLFPIKMKKINFHVINLDHSSQYTFYHLNLNFLPQKQNGNIQLALNSQLSANHANKKIPFNLTLQLIHNQQIFQFKSGHLTLGNLTANINPVKMPAVSKLQSVIDIPPFNLAQLADSLSFSLPGKNSAWHKVAATANLVIANSSLQFDNINLKANDNVLQGRIRYQFNPLAKLNFQLHAKTIDIDDFLNKSIRSDRNNKQQQIPQFNPLPFALSGNLKVENLLFEGLDFTPISIHVDSNGQAILFNPIRFKLQQGSGLIKANITPENTQLQISSYVNFHHIYVAPLLKRFTKSTNFKGTLDLISDFETTGFDFANWITNLAGKGQIKVTDGTIKGIDIPYVLQSAASLFHSTPQMNNQHETQFSSLASSYTIENGVISNQALSMQVGRYLLKAKGTINLNNNQLALSFITNNGQPSNQYVIPLSLTGTINKPSLTLNQAAIKKEFIHQSPSPEKDVHQHGFFEKLKSVF